MRLKRLGQEGFTLVELLIVITIIAILSVLIFLTLNPFKQFNKSYDAVRKKDLDRIKISLEDYNSDHLCYPPAGILDVCDGDQLLPYLDNIPCDPQSKLPYLYVPETNNCSGYRLLTTLRDKTDPFIEQAGCSGVTGCGGVEADYNYGVSSGVPVGGGVLTPTATPTGTTTPTPSPIYPPGNYACDVDWNCNDFGYPNSCPVSYLDAQVCNDQCAAQLGSRCL